MVQQTQNGVRRLNGASDWLWLKENVSDETANNDAKNDIGPISAWFRCVTTGLGKTLETWKFGVQNEKGHSLWKTGTIRIGRVAVSRWMQERCQVHTLDSGHNHPEIIGICCCGHTF